MMNFPRFGELPPELQDLVWEFSIPQPSPIAHCAHLQPGSRKPLMALHVYGPVRGRHASSLKRSRGPSFDTEAYRGFERPKVLRKLLQTTRRSRTVSLRHPDALEPVESTILAGWGEPLSNVADPRCYDLQINVATDLVVLDKMHRSDSLGYGTLDKTWVQRLDPIRYLAVPYPGNERELDHQIKVLVKPYRHLRVLYVLLEPEDLQDCKGPWEQDLNSKVGSSSGGGLSLFEYLEAYKEGRFHPGPFRCGQREYFEVPAEQIRFLEGLESLIGVLENIRVRRRMKADRQLVGGVDVLAEGKFSTMDDIEPMRFRFMSWRHL